MSTSHPGDILDALNRYRELQAAVREKEQIEKQLADYLSGLQAEELSVDLPSGPVRIRLVRQSDIRYNNEMLKERLGERYEALLKPDLEKIREHLDAISPCFDNILEYVGSVSPEKVREAIEDGIVEKEEFDGAYSKTTHRRIDITYS